MSWIYNRSMDVALVGQTSLKHHKIQASLKQLAKDVNKLGGFLSSEKINRKKVKWESDGEIAYEYFNDTNIFKN